MFLNFKKFSELIFENLLIIYLFKNSKSTLLNSILLQFYLFSTLQFKIYFKNFISKSLLEHLAIFLKFPQFFKNFLEFGLKFFLKHLYSTNAPAQINEAFL